MTKKRKRRKPEQVVKLLQDGEGMLAAGKALGEVYQKLEVSEATWMRWKKQFGGMKSVEAKRLGELEVENQRLKEMLAEAELDKRILKAAIEGNY
jgi:putative transposase